MLALTVLAFVVAPTTAGATGAGDTIYWGNEFGAVRSGPLTPGTASNVRTGAPCGVALDPSAGRSTGPIGAARAAGSWSRTWTAPAYP